MTTYGAGDTVVIEVHLYDQNGSAVTDASAEDFTALCYLRSKSDGSGSVVTPSGFSHVSGPIYIASISDATSGIYTAAIQCSATPGISYEWSADVLPAAADPAAIADALAAVQSDVTTVKAMTDVATSTRATPGAYVAAGGTVATNGDIEIRRGNAYLNADGLALPWSSSSWPVLTSATITLQAESAYDDRVTFSAAGAVVTATGTTKAVRVELSEAQTTALTAGDWTYVVHAVLASGNDVELASGAMTVLDPLGA